jgi:DNA-binding NarL/FixJ family response regulator
MSSSSKTILVVDDYPLILERLRILLLEMEEVDEVLAAGSYTHSLEILQQRTPDLALLDIHLPDRNGICILEYIKACHPGVWVIMMSNHYHSTYRDLCKEKGADYFIDKSNDFEKLPELISSFFAGTR